MSFTLRGATLIDGTGTDPLRAHAVTIDGDRITRVGTVERGGSQVELDGLTLLPGLIDAHTHLGSVPGTRAGAGATPAAEIAAQIFRNCELALDAGFTTCRETGGVDWGIVRAVDQGQVRGPRILSSGPAIAQDGGHGTLMAPFSDCVCPLDMPGLVNGKAVCDCPDAVRLAARRAFRRGATQLKLMATGGVVSLTDELTDTQLTVDEIRAAVAEAEARKTYVTIHAHNCGGIRNGVLAGVRCVEHGTYLDEETAVLMSSHGVALVPTFTVVDLMPSRWRDWGLPELVVPRLEGVEEAMASALMLARALRVDVGSGSDLLGLEQERRGRELVIRARLEDPMRAIVSATSANARILGQGHAIGTVEPGKLADLIAIEGDPLAEPELFDRPDRVVLVIKAGRVVKDTGRLVAA